MGVSGSPSGLPWFVPSNSQAGLPSAKKSERHKTLDCFTFLALNFHLPPGWVNSIYHPAACVAVGCPHHPSAPMAVSPASLTLQTPLWSIFQERKSVCKFNLNLDKQTKWEIPGPGVGHIICLELRAFSSDPCTYKRGWETAGEERRSANGLHMGPGQMWPRSY